MNLEEMTARDLMTEPIQTADPDSTLLEAARQMTEIGIHCLVVLPETPGRSPGIITAKDVVQLLGDAEPHMLEELCVRDVMTSPAVTLPEYLRIPDCINVMRMTGIRSAPITSGQELVGMLSFTDVLRWASRQT